MRSHTSALGSVHDLFRTSAAPTLIPTYFALQHACRSPTLPEMIPPIGLKTEADVEFKLLHALLTDSLMLAIPEECIRNKEYLAPTVLDKRAGKSSGYIPDFAIVIGSLPLVIVEAKSPDVDAETGYREAGLYAYHLNKQFKSGLNPCQIIVSTNGRRILAGRWDTDPSIKIRVKDLSTGGASLKDLKDLCHYTVLIELYNRLAPSLRARATTTPVSLSGGNALLNAKKAPNTFAAPLSPILKRYFSSNQQNTDREIYDHAYVTSQELESYDDTLRR